MEPRIQYAKTADGVRIAFWTMGEGEPPLLQVPGLTSPLTVESQVPRLRPFMGHIAAKRMLVQYDMRGTGMSDREVRDFSLDARMRDLEAVADRLGLERFALYAVFSGGPTAIAFAAKRPERVSHLILTSSYASGPALLEIPGMRDILRLIDSDWTLYTEAVAHVVFGWDVGGIAHNVAAAMRESMSYEAAKAALATLMKDDVRGLLPLVQAPALVVHRREGMVPLNATQELAAGIPNARLVAYEGTALPLVGDPGPAIAAIDEFLGEGEPTTATAAALAQGSFRTVLFTDIVGHTEMMSRLGDERGREVLREHERITRDVLKVHGGTEVKTMGDGFMASFGSVTKAVECAMALQRAIGNWQSEIGERIAVRCGLNAGEPIEEEGDLFGATVILASRIAAKAEGGEILVADTVRGLCSGKGFLFSDRGEFVAKGFEEPVRVYEVRWSFDSPSAGATGGSG